MINEWVRSLIDYVRGPVTRAIEEFDDGIEREIAFHVSERTDEYVARGHSPDEAQRLATKQFGSRARIAMECRAKAVGGLIIWHRLHLCLTTALIVGIGGLLFFGRRWVNDTSRFTSSLPPGIASMLDNDWTGSITGQILDNEGNPLEGAQVLITVKTWPDHTYFQRSYSAASDRQGRFTIHRVYPLNEMYEVQLATLAIQHELKSTYLSEQLAPLEFQTIVLPVA